MKTTTIVSKCGDNTYTAKIGPNGLDTAILIKQESKAYDDTNRVLIPWADWPAFRDAMERYYVEHTQKGAKK